MNVWNACASNAASSCNTTAGRKVATSVALVGGVSNSCSAAPPSDQPTNSYGTPPTSCGSTPTERITPTTPVNVFGVGHGAPSSNTTRPGGSVASVTVDLSGRRSRATVLVRPKALVAVRCSRYHTSALGSLSLGMVKVPPVTAGRFSRKGCVCSR